MNDLLIQFTASVLIWIMFAGVFLLWVIDGKFKKEAALHALFAVGVSWVVANILKEVIPTQRPFILNELPTLVFIAPTNGAFPSAHSAFAFAMATTIWLHNKKWGFFYLVMALLVGAARVLGNVHYPIDILGGALLGVVISLMIERIHLFEILKKVRAK